MKHDWVAYISIAILVMIWGSAFALTHLALEGFSPLGVSTGRLILGALVVTPVAFLSGQGLPKTLQHWKWCGLLGTVNFAVPFALISWGQQEVPSSITATFVSGIPLLVLFFSWLLLKQHISKRKWVGFIVGIIGLIWLADPQALNSGDIQIVSYLAIIAACVGMALGAIVIGVMPNLPPIQAMAATLLISALLSLPLGWHEIPNGFSNQNAVIGLILLGIFPTGVAQVLRFFTVKRTSPVFVSTGGYLIPICAGFLGIVFLHETLTLNAVLAYALIITGVLISRDRVRSRPQQP